MMMIYLDLDGLIVDFISAACEVFEIDEKELQARWPPGEWDIHKVIGVSKSQFYDRIESAGEDFWVDAPLYPWADELYNFCSDLAPTYILTTPTLDPACLSGKMKFLYRWKGKGFRDYVFTPAKELCAMQGKCLIDDKDKNCHLFNENDGKGILFPTHTNSRHGEVHSAVEIVKAEVIEWFNKEKYT